MRLAIVTENPSCFSDIAEIIHIFFPDASVVLMSGNNCHSTVFVDRAQVQRAANDAARENIGGTQSPEANIYYPDTNDEKGMEDSGIVAHFHRERDGWAENAFAYQGVRYVWTIRIDGDAWEQKRRRKRGMKQACYYLMKKITGLSPPWGSLTGIRPTLLFHARLSTGEKPPDIREALIKTYDLREEKARLLYDIALVQQPLRNTLANAFDLYVGIPFCVSRCSYCSFFAETVGNGQKILPYVDTLLAELQATSEIALGAGLSPRALYVGGGTPTAIGVKPLETILRAVDTLFGGFMEITVEAGRPDTLSTEMLRMIKDSGVTRVSVNPQTMNDRTLQAIGRNHTAKESVAAYAKARKMGFDNINMDVIAALPGEMENDFERTMRIIANLSPDSLTVHMLARKHGSVINEKGFTPAPPAAANAMVGMGHDYALRMNMRPYYLYRQKYVAGNLENVGYAKPAKECLYNIDMMEETASILAAGAGAISKRVWRDGSRIERAPNAGDIGHYMSRVREMIERKRKLWRV